MTRTVRGAAGVALVLSTAWYGIDGLAQQRTTAIRSAPPFSAQQLLAPPRQGWVTNGGTLFNQRYAEVAGLDRTNVARLKGVWRTHLKGSGLEPKYSAEAQPIVHDGVVYVPTGANDVFALSVETGEILWEYQAKLGDLTTVCCGWLSRGVGFGDGKVFVGQLDGKLVALDQRSGEPIWSIQAERWQEGFTITSAPLYYDGLVIAGFAGAEFGVRGRVKAFDADDGTLRWTFYTVPGPGQFGHDTWPQDNDVWRHGGASVWHTPAVDPALGLVYFSTGNAGPDYNGAVRAGDNLFSASIVAVDVRTGEYRWHFQQVHHDIWDYDAPNPVILFDAVVNGVERQALAQAGKTGWVYILDRRTGEPIVGIEERPVPQEPRQKTAATQPYPIGDAVVPQSVDVAPLGFELVNQGRIFTPFFGPKGVIASPGVAGGINWPPSSYDPVRRTMFVCANHTVGRFIGGDRDFEIPPAGQRYDGGVTAFADLPVTGIFAAMDVTTNRIVWRNRWRDNCWSGSVATSTGLVFTGRNDGRLMALDADNGAPLWEFQTGAGMNSTASVFEHDGEPYVVVLSGGNTLQGTPRGDSVWLFGLRGTIDQTTPGDTRLSSATFDPARLSGEPNLVAGAQIYQQSCVPCHGDDGAGGHGGGAPLTRVAGLPEVIRVVVEGRNAMPPFKAALTAQQIRDVSAFIVERLQRDR